MTHTINKAHYFKIGQSLYKAGLIIFFGAARSWQHQAKIDGYKAARAEWVAAHPEASEWDAATARNTAFCKQAIKGVDHDPH